MLRKVLSLIIINALVIVILVAIVFSVGEIALRVFKPHYTPLEATTQKGHKYLFEPNKDWQHVSAVPGEFDALIKVNSFGYRGTEFSREKPESEKRVFFVGDSFTFGVGAEEDETIPARVEQRLHAQGKNAVSVINAGVGHTSPLSYYINTRDIHMQFSPDLVVMLLDFSDLSNDWKDERHLVYDKDGKIDRIDYAYVNGRFDLWRWCVLHSAMAKYLNNKFVRLYKKVAVLGVREYFAAKLRGENAKNRIVQMGKKDASRDTIEYDGYLFMRGSEQSAAIALHWQRTAGYILKTKAFLEERGIPMLLVMYPYGIHISERGWHEGRTAWGYEQNKVYDDYFSFELVASFCEHNDIPFINTLGSFLAQDGDKARFHYPYDGHLNAAGNAVVAEAIVQNEHFKSAVESMLSR